MAMATIILVAPLTVLLLAMKAASSFDHSPPTSRVGARRSTKASSVDRGMSTSAAATGGGRGSGSGTSSWPSMQRPPADGVSNDASNTDSVPAIMNYVSPETTEISTRRDLGGSDDALVGAIWNPTQVRVTNARLLDGDDKMTLDGNGFELWSDPKGEEGSTTTTVREMDFCFQDQIVDEYYPICERLVSDAIMSQKQSASSPPIACFFAFDHNVRSNARSALGKIKSKRTINEEEGTGQVVATPQVQSPAGLVHADYTKTSAPRRLHDLSNPPKINDVLRPKLVAENRKSLLDPTMVQEALDGKRRYAFINVWRSIDTENTVKNPPLACVDAATASMEDLRTFKIHYVDRVGENYFVCPPPSSSSDDRQQHSWCYYPEMSIDETLLLKQWDSMGGIACGRQSDTDAISTFTIHSAFIDPCAGESPARKSIEVRCVVIWEEDET